MQRAKDGEQLFHDASSFTSDVSHVEYSTRKMQRNCEDHLMVQLKLRIDQEFLSIIKKACISFQV